MVQPAPAGSAAPGSAPAPRHRLWLGPLLAGLCFGLGYGLTQRLLDLNVAGLVRFGQRFDVQPFPGTGLDSLRLRFGEESHQIRGSLEPPQLEQQPSDPAAARPPEPAPPDPAAAVEPRREPAPEPDPAAAERAPDPLPPTAPVEPPAPASAPEPAPANLP